MKEILSKAVLLGLPILVAALLVATSLAVADIGGLFLSDEPVAPNYSESDKPEEYDYKSVTEDHPVSPNGGESDKPREYDYGSVIDDEPVNPSGGAEPGPPANDGT